MKTVRTVLHLTPELRAAIEEAKGEAPMSGFVEHALWKLKAIKDGAAEAGVENPGRPIDKRGIWERPAKEGA
jgi:hypothetical protein